MKLHIPAIAAAFAFVAFGAQAPEAHAAPPAEPSAGAPQAATAAPKGEEDAKPLEQVCIDLPWGTTICCTARSCVSF